jgi:hypothetical protein
MIKSLYGIKLRDHKNNFHLKYDKNLDINIVKGFSTPSINYNRWITKQNPLKSRRQPPQSKRFINFFVPPQLSFTQPSWGLFHLMNTVSLCWSPPITCVFTTQKKKLNFLTKLVKDFSPSRIYWGFKSSTSKKWPQYYYSNYKKKKKKKTFVAVWAANKWG